ncbi:hypothetical protein ISN44_As12g016820 [Arabidopsis suecica]|uniref:Uncharacterized protein n=1 Tax=Arabidopsis suecica TaxID=45249 RepID=A0A8T1YJA6_ARASU|nr:hypothetical protein ISN44_As12g016820 [Arabidopsis suecica]
METKNQQRERRKMAERETRYRDGVIVELQLGLTLLEAAMAARDDVVARLRKRMEVMTSSMQSMIPLIPEKAEQDAASERLEEKEQHSGFRIADAVNRYTYGIFFTKLILR